MNIVLALLLLANFQTRPRPDQIRNANQVRICNAAPACVDPRPGTLLPWQQIQDNRQKLPSPAYIVDPGNPATAGDVGKPTVCIAHYIGINLGVDAAGHATGYVIASQLCYTQYGLGLLLNDPAWAAWWAVQP